MLRSLITLPLLCMAFLLTFSAHAKAPISDTKKELVPSLNLLWESTRFFAGNENIIPAMTVHAMQEGIFILATNTTTNRTAYFEFSPQGKLNLVRAPFPLTPNDPIATGVNTFFHAGFNPHNPAKSGIARLFTPEGTESSTLESPFVIGNYTSITPSGSKPPFYAVHYANLATDSQWITAFSPAGDILWRTELPQTYSLLASVLGQFNDSLILISGTQGIQLNLDGTVIKTLTIPSLSGLFTGPSLLAPIMQLDTDSLLLVGKTIRDDITLVLHYHVATQQSTEYSIASHKVLSPRNNKHLLLFNDQWLVEEINGTLRIYDKKLAQVASLPLPLEGERSIYDITKTPDGNLLVLGFLGKNPEEQVPFLAKFSLMEYTINK